MVGSNFFAVLSLVLTIKGLLAFFLVSSIYYIENTGAISKGWPSRNRNKNLSLFLRLADLDEQDPKRKINASYTFQLKGQDGAVHQQTEGNH